MESLFIALETCVICCAKTFSAVEQHAVKHDKVRDEKWQIVVLLTKIDCYEL